MKKLNFLLTIILVLSIATCGVISSAMIAWSLSSGPGESTYNYTLVSTAAYCDVDAIPFTGKTGAITGNLNSRVLANDTEFKAISASDDSRWKTSDPGLGDEVFMWFQQTTDEYAPSVEQIDLTFEGYLDTTATFQIRAYNNNTGVWDQIGTTMSIPSGSDSTMTRSITSNCDDYIDSTNLGMLNWGVYAAVTDQMNIDYVEAVVSYATWEEMDSGTTSTLYNIWGTSSSNIYTVGDDGLFHYDGSTWSEIDAATESSLYSIWGWSSVDVFAAGSSGTLVHYNGSAWVCMNSSTSQNLFSIWGSSSTDVFAVGSNGTIIHYNGSAWSEMESGTSQNLWGVWGTSSSDVYVSGGFYSNPGLVILHYNGSAWSEMDPNTETGTLIGIWGSSSNDIFCGGLPNILHYNGSAWSEFVSIPNEAGIINLWGSCATDVFAVGDDWSDENDRDLIMHYNGNEWTVMESPASGSDSWLWGIWGTGPYDVYAVGGNGIILHYN